MKLYQFIFADGVAMRGYSLTSIKDFMRALNERDYTKHWKGYITSRRAPYFRAIREGETVCVYLGDHLAERNLIGYIYPYPTEGIEDGITGM